MTNLESVQRHIDAKKGKKAADNGAGWKREKKNVTKHNINSNNRTKINKTKLLMHA